MHFPIKMKWIMNIYSALIYYRDAKAYDEEHEE